MGSSGLLKWLHRARYLAIEDAHAMCGHIEYARREQVGDAVVIIWIRRLDHRPIARPHATASNRQLAHLATMLGAIAAGPSAEQHPFVTLECLTILRARIAKLRAGDADSGMLRRAPKKRIGRFLTHLGAVSQQRQMLRHDMPAAVLEAVTLRLKAHDMRTPAALDAGLRSHHPRSHARHGWRRGACRLSPGRANGNSDCGNHGEGGKKLATVPHI